MRERATALRLSAAQSIRRAMNAIPARVRRWALVQISCADIDLKIHSSGEMRQTQTDIQTHTHTVRVRETGTGLRFSSRVGY